MTKSPTVLEIVKPDIREVDIDIKGVSPLICHKWSEKAKKEMLDKQMKKAAKGKQAKDPEADYRASLYELGDGYGFPSVAFKSAAVRAAKQVGMAMTDARCAFHVKGELTPIVGEPSMREDMVRLNGATADIRHRGQFEEWSATLKVVYNSASISVEQLRSLFELAGFAVGVGEWRPEKNGQFGCFTVVG